MSAIGLPKRRATYPCPIWTRIAIRLGNIIAVILLIASSWLFSGCTQRREWAPALQLPVRPLLQEIPEAQWLALPRATRVIIVQNMALLMQHTERLEHTITAYNEWRDGQR